MMLEVKKWIADAVNDKQEAVAVTTAIQEEIFTDMGVVGLHEKKNTICSRTICVIKNSATLAGSLFTLHASQIRIKLPTLTEKDKEFISSWGVQNKIDFLSLSYTRHVEDVRQARDLLSELPDLSQTQIFAKIENVETDGIILSCGNLGIDLPPEKVFLFQKSTVYKCNMAGKPAVVTRVVDSMTDNLRPTRAEATDVVNAVLDGCDAILLGAETLRGLYPVETISTLSRICVEILYHWLGIIVQRKFCLLKVYLCARLKHCMERNLMIRCDMSAWLRRLRESRNLKIILSKLTWKQLTSFKYVTNW